MARILVVDDEEPLARIVADCLRKEGHAVEVCLDSSAAAAAARDSGSELALIDYQMPGKTGVELLAEFRARAETERMPVLFLSGTDAVRFAMLVPPEPRVRFLRKPVDKESLLTMVREMLDPDGWSSHGPANR